MPFIIIAEGLTTIGKDQWCKTENEESMNTEKQKVYVFLSVLLDSVVVAMAYVIGYWIQFYIQKNLAPFDTSKYALPVLMIVFVYVLAGVFFRLYRPFRMTGRRKEALIIIKSNITGALILFAAFFVIANTEGFDWIVGFSRMMILWMTFFNICLMVLWRNCVRLASGKLGGSRFRHRSVLVIGYSRAAQEYIERIVTHKQWGYEIIGILDDHVESGSVHQGITCLGKISCLEKVLSQNRAENIVIALELKDYARLEHIVHICEKSGVHTEFVPDYSNIISTKPYTEDLLGLPLIHIRHVPLMDAGNACVKRGMDILGSLVCIVLFSPIMLGAAIAVKISSPGPLIFRQERVGLHNRPFMMYKFRSMTVQKPSEEKDKWTTKNDMRVTGVGRVIRKTSIDELPQLFNVLKGEMSLVGPRPERPFFVDKFKEEIPRYMIKHQVRPGMTGWAQVNGLRGDTSIRKRIELDLYYIENWSALFDIRILFLTVFKGFINKNAY